MNKMSFNEEIIYLIKERPGMTAVDLTEFFPDSGPARVHREAERLVMNLRQALGGAYMESPVDLGEGPIVIITPLRYISLSTLRFEARRRQGGVPDYMRSKPAQ
jgi:hypothetical protein